MLYLMSLNHTPEKCPGVAPEIRDRALLMASTMTEVLKKYGCAYQGGWVSKSAHQTFLVIDGPHAHAVENAAVDLGLAVWNTSIIYPVITIEEAFGGLPE